MNSNTPRTDAQSVDHIGYYSCAKVPSSFARQLETELNEAKTQSTSFLKAWVEASQQLAESRAREAGYREALEQIGEYWNHAPESAVDAIETAEGLAADALSQAAPPVVPLADVKPLLEALNHVALDSHCHDLIEAFTTKYTSESSVKTSDKT